MKNYTKRYTIPAPPEEVWMALTQPATIELWTGEPASMVLEPGAEFEMWNGSIAGRILEFVEYSLLEQEWYFGEQEQPSVVTFRLARNGESTTIELSHTNIPDADFKDIIHGWDKFYFGALREFYTV